jgi:PAS domain-containing protein
LEYKLEQKTTFIEEHLYTIFNASPSPIYVCSGENFIVKYANEATLKAWGKDASVIGKPFTDALPEIIDQPFPKLLLEVYRTGITYHSKTDRGGFRDRW